MKDFSFILDNVLKREEFLEYQSYLKNVAIYQTIQADGNKNFYMTNVPCGLQEKITTALEKVWNAEIKVILPAVRKATQYLDTNWGIH